MVKDMYPFDLEVIKIIWHIWLCIQLHFGQGNQDHENKKCVASRDLLFAIRRLLMNTEG